MSVIADHDNKLGLARLQICLYLTPLDLLRLTRLSKKFRAVLLSSQGKYVWKLVYNSHFDTIIPGWSEPKMVSYLLEEHCDVGLSPVIPSLRRDRSLPLAGLRQA